MALTQNRISRLKLQELSSSLFDRFRESPSRLDALKLVEEAVAREFGEQLAIPAYDDVGDLDVAFIEVLDQTLFELNAERTGTNGGGIDEYIINNLHARVSAFLLIANDAEAYRKNLRDREINIDDPIIIRHHRLGEFVPRLTAEFADYPNLQYQILKTLLTFDDDILLPFYYDIVKGECDIALKVMALIGLHRFRTRFGNWRNISHAGDGEFDALVSHVHAFDPENPALPSQQDAPLILVFALLYLEQRVISGVLPYGDDHLFAVLCAIAQRHADVQQRYQHLHESLAAIFMHIDADHLGALLEDKRRLLAFLKVVDLFPLEGFEKILIVINRLGPRFLKTAERVITAGEIQFEKNGPTLIGYILSLNAEESL